MDLWVQRKARQKQGKKYTVLVSSAHTAIQERRNMTYNELGKDFF